MSREHLGRAAKVVSVEVRRKRTFRELSMEMTPAARADHSKTVKRLVIPADERLDPFWHNSELLMEPHESYAPGGIRPRVMKECVDGYSAAFTNGRVGIKMGRAADGAAGKAADGIWSRAQI